MTQCGRRDNPESWVFPDTSSDSLIALVDFDASGDSTNLEDALNGAIDALAMQAGNQRRLWLFTDGDAEFQFDMIANRIQETGLQSCVYEATGKPSPTPLQLLCERTGGVHYAIAE